MQGKQGGRSRRKLRNMKRKEMSKTMWKERLDIRFKCEKMKEKRNAKGKEEKRTCQRKERKIKVKIRWKE